ncbi:hypothetical protein BTO05_02670 [Winogradskyella sp. PC-19]|uniref:hypothetical protein n=1 Tax=unclassified Winogradskyella TaxID=2615021 RepID=UPI000B3C0665|nr:MULTISPECIES: hypothetical protein [unclassified Winogradskyella]ARV08596.1 hypothetical protein BTO05_02670 [Winogradskyella sp. PC-19]RZN77438.1 MAG: hypothetical protein EVB12_05990 [Winogradskyella sp.]
MTNETINEGKQFAVIAYITIIGTLIAYYLSQEKKNAFTAFHVRQGLGLWLLFFILGYVVGGFNSWEVTTAFYIFFLVLFSYGVIGAVTGKLHKLPLVGDVFQKIFKALQ